MPTYIKSSDTLLFKIVNRRLHLIYSIIINSKAEINIIIDGHIIPLLRNSNEMKNYDNYINVSIEFSLVGDTAIKKVDLKYEDFDQIADHDKLAG